MQLAVVERDSINSKTGGVLDTLPINGQTTGASRVKPRTIRFDGNNLVMGATDDHPWFACCFIKFNTQVASFGYQTENLPLHGGQSRLWSTEQC